MDKAFVKGLVRDWGVALAIGALIFIAWKLMAGGPVTTGRIDSVRMLDLAGEEVDLANFYETDKPIVLNFWATWCGPCVVEIPHFVSYQKNHPDITVLGVSLDENKSLSALQAFAKRRNMNYTVLHDAYNEARNSYGVQTLPTTYVLGSDGTIRQVRVGVVTESTLDRMVQAAQ